MTRSTPPRRGCARATPLAACLLAVALLCGAAGAQPVLRGEVGIDVTPTVTSRGSLAELNVATLIRARLEAEHDLGGGWRWHAVMAPALGARGTPEDPIAEPGPIEAVVQHRGDDVDLSFGLERLPLGEARQTRPLRLDPRWASGEERGLLGARATAYLGPWRVRGAALYDAVPNLASGAFGVAASVRRELGAFTVEAHALHLRRAAFGASFSGLIDPVVVYGDVWWLSDPAELRGALGASGYFGDVLWTLEAAHAPPEGGLAGSPRPELAASASRPLGDRGDTLELALSSAWPEPAQAQGPRSTELDASLTWTADLGSERLSVGPFVRHDARATTYGASLSLRAYF